MSPASSDARFEAAADAIVAGDVATLRRLLAEEPALVRARSTREHRATLLHYVAANGVEDERQKTPPNIVAIANVLMDAGAEVDATADMYGGGCTTLGLAATSVHPERAGVQEALLQTLLDRGATFDPASIVEACVANGRARAAEFFIARGASFDLRAAAALGRTADVARLLDEGADIAAAGPGGQTPLHLAVIAGQLETAKLLLQYNPPLEATNVFGGTVLGQARWSAAHGGDPAIYRAIIEMLIAAGAKT